MKIPNWLTDWWKRIGEFNPLDECCREEEYPYVDSKRCCGTTEDDYCPFCGYSGNADEIRCHLLNCHSKCK